jgi:dTDP-glucose pyrophosphorylase/predicted transcriptional regulator
VRNINNITIDEQVSILDTLKIIDQSSKRLALVVDTNNKLLGTISDGDIRRALLRSINLEDSIKDIYCKCPTVANINDSKESIINTCISKKLHQIPIVDNDNNLVGLEILDELLSKKSRSSKVVLMVGGLGTRLRPLTEDIPKPMLQVGDKPILQTIIERFAAYGFTNIIMCVNYKSSIIQDYFGDGTQFGLDIEYVLEEKRMGTAGALGLIKDKLTEPFFVMNGDLLTNVNFEHLYDYHLSTNAIATMCVRKYDFQVPYGIVNIDNSKVTSIEEKPIYDFFVSAGIYMLSSEVLDYIPEGEYYDMPTLFETLIENKKNTLSFPLREYWLDIGRLEDYEKANRDYFKVF